MRPDYYRKTIIMLTYFKLKDFADMENSIDDLMREMDETLVMIEYGFDGFSV